MKNYSRSIAVILMAAVMFCMGPAASVMAIGGPMTANRDRDKSDGSTAEAAANQVVVLYEDGEIPAQNGSKKTRGAGSAESVQEEIIDKALDGDFSVDDTIVIETADEEAGDMVVGIVSSDDYSAEELAETLQDADGIRFAEPNYKYTISSFTDWNDTYIEDAWQLGNSGLNVDSAPAAAESGDEVVLAVMDTGIDYTHPDLADRMWTAPDGFTLKGEHGVDWSDEDDDPLDENGHGTHCAGIIAAAADNSEGIAGVAGDRANVKLMAVRVLDAEGSGYLDDIVRAFKYLIRAKNEGVNIKAVNCSFGAETTSDIFDEAIEQAGQAGILTIVAAGNETSDNDSTNVSPANSKSDYVLVVAATDEDGSLASYSNYGRKNVDVAAPGSNILSSVSYYNYAPYLYDKAALKKTTQVYGEFGGAVIDTDEEGVQSVTPVLGTDYDGSDIEDISTFGASKKYDILSEGSEGHSSLEITDGTEDGAFAVGNNQQSLRWKIEDAQSGDQYILFFPYDKLKGDPYINMVFRGHTGNGEDGDFGDLMIGDIKIDDIDSEGNVSYSTTAEDTMYGTYIDPTWNSIWQASGLYGALYSRADIKDLNYGDFGLGFVYSSGDGGDVYIDISSLAIAKDSIDESLFGAYDVYSGTSMATPAVTGAAGLIAAADPDIDAEALKATLMSTTTSVSALSGQCSTGGKVDFASYSGQAEEAKPSISSVNADFGKGTLTIKGRGFGDAPQVKVFRNAVTEGDGAVAIDAADIKASGDTIKISKAGYSGYGLIGSDIRFEITNGDRTGEGSYYTVKGLTPYNDEFCEMYEAGDEFEIWDTGAKANDEEGSTEDYEEGENIDPMMPSGLNYVTGSNDLYKYSSTGDIVLIDYNDDDGKYYPTYLGMPAKDALTEYTKKKAETVDLWKPDMDGDEESLNYSLVGTPVYTGNIIYELLRVDLVDRDAYVLMGLDLNDEAYEWNVYYDSLAGFGTKPAQLDFRLIDKATLVAYGGRIYMLGGNVMEDYDELTDEYTVEICKDFFSCKPDLKGTAWKYEGELPKEMTNGKAMVSNGKLYYFLTNDAEGTIDYSIYSYDGSSWTKAGELPKALFSDTEGWTIQWIGDMLMISFDGTETVFTATGIDSKGIIFAGKSFDGPGDTFRFNTKTNKIEPLKYSLWETISDRKVDGTAAGNRFFVEYEKELTQEAVGKSIPITSGFVTLDKYIEGEGSGTVTGGGSYVKGDKSAVTITPDKGSYIYSISSSGFSPELNKKYGASTKESRAKVTSTFKAASDGTLEVYFGKVSTKVTIPKQTLTKKVGTGTVKAYTNGTINGVKWSSGNTKYATVNKDGTITFKRAGVGKTVTLTATSKEVPSLKATCKVKIVSREKTKFVWNGKKFTSKTKVMVDNPLKKAKKVKKLKVKEKSGNAVLSWKKAKDVSGYIVFRKTGKGRFTQVAKLSAKKKTYTDKSVKKGKNYQYLVVSYKSVSGSKAVRISPVSKVKKFKKK